MAKRGLGVAILLAAIVAAGTFALRSKGRSDERATAVGACPRPTGVVGPRSVVGCVLDADGKGVAGADVVFGPRYDKPADLMLAGSDELTMLLRDPRPVGIA